VRWHDEKLTRELGKNVTLIRINPEEKVGSSAYLNLPTTGLAALQHIDKLLKKRE